MPVEEIKVKITADKADVDGAFKDIKGTANKVETESKRAATSIGSVISAVVGAAAVSKITSFFSAAISSYNKLDSALGRVESTSKALGQSIEKNKKQVMDLADQGFLSLTESANAFSDALLLGLDPTKAKKFVESLSDIAAVERTMGTLNEAVSSGIAGLRSGSSERVENIGVSVKKLSQEYQINAQKLGQTAAVEKFYQGVLKESNKYRGEAIKTVDTLAGAQTKYNAAVEKTQAAIGKGLEPVMKAFYSIATQILNTFEKWFSGLDSTAQGILLIGAAATALVPVLGVVVGLFGALALNPVVLGIMAAVVAFTAIAAAVANANRSLEDRQKQARKGYSDESAELKKLTASVENLERVQKRTLQQERELTNSKEALRKKAQELGEDYDALVRKLGSYAKALEVLDRRAKEKKVEESLDPEIRERDKALDSYSEKKAKFDLKEKERRDLYNRENLSTGEMITRNRLDSESAGLAKEVAEAEELYKKREDRVMRLRKEGLSDPVSDAMPKPGAGTGGGKGTPEFRFIKARDELRELQKEYDAYIRKVGKTSDLGKEATVKLGVEQERVQGQLRQAIAEYNEERTLAELEAQNVAYQQARANIYELANAEKLSKEEVEKKLQRAKEANAYKIAQINAESYTRTLQGANQIVSAIATGGAAAGGGVLSGLGAAGKELTAQGVFSEDGNASRFFKTASIVGPIMNAAGGLLTGITGLFSKSGAQLAREADAQRRRDEEARAILELQAGYQKSMLALQEAQAQLPFGNLTRKLRLIEIQAQQERAAGGDEKAIEQRRLAARQQAIQQTIEQKAGSIGAGKLFSGVEATPESLIAVLNEAAALKIETEPLAELSRQLRDSVYNGGAEVTRAIQDKIFEELRRLGYDAGWIQSGNARLGNYGSTLYQAFAEITGSPARDSSIPLSTKDKLIAQIIQSGGSDLSELNIDTTTAESLLSVIEQSLQAQLDIEKNTKATAENTTKLVDGKGDAIVDIAAGGLTQNGAFIGGGLLKFLMGKATIDAAGMMLNPSIQNAMLSSQFLDSFNSRMDSNLDKLVSLTEQEVELLKIIAENLVRNDVTPERESLKQQILQIIEEFGSRS